MILSAQFGGPLDLNENPRNGKPVFSTSAFEGSPWKHWVMPHGLLPRPGIENFDVQLTETIRVTESKTLDIRMEAFNVFNHAQFYGPQAVDGVDTDPDFGHVVSAGRAASDASCG